MRATTHRALKGALAAGMLGIGTTGRAADGNDPPCHSPAMAASGAPSGARPAFRYTVPDVEMVRADGAKVRSRAALEDPRPVVLNFIFTTCGAICPVMSQTLAKVQDRLGEDRTRVTMISVSIDPERDTPERLRAYAKKYGATPGWSFYTGSTEASVALQKAFDVYRGNKMNHVPVTFVRTAPGGPWIRLEGLGNADVIVGEVRPALAVSDRRRP